MNINAIQLYKCSNSTIYPNNNVLFDVIPHVLGTDMFYDKHTGTFTITKKGLYCVDWDLFLENCPSKHIALEFSLITSSSDKVLGSFSNCYLEFSGYYIMMVEDKPISFSIKNTSSNSYGILNSKSKVKASLTIIDLTDMKGETGPQGPIGPQGLQGPQGPMS